MRADRKLSCLIQLNSIRHYCSLAPQLPEGVGGGGWGETAVNSPVIPKLKFNLDVCVQFGHFWVPEPVSSSVRPEGFRPPIQGGLDRFSGRAEGSN